MVNWVLALDIGSKKTGIAVGQDLTKTARPLKTLRKKSELLSYLDFMPIISEWKVKTILIGYPLLADGKEHFLAKTILRLEKEFKENGFEVALVSEYLTSYEAQKRFPKHKNYDCISAQIMIEDFFSL